MNIKGKLLSREEKNLPFKVSTYLMDNGLKLIAVEDRWANTFSYQTWIHVGSRFEQPGKTGLAHLFEHLMFKESKNLRDGEFDRIMEEHGAQVNAATWIDFTYYHEELPSTYLELAISLEAERLENLILNEKQVFTELEVVKNERRYRVDNNPDGFLYEQLMLLAFEKHPYRNPVIGYMEDLENLTLQDCLNFHKMYYAPDNLTLVVCGDITPDETAHLVDKFYGHLKPSGVKAPLIQPEAPITTAREKTFNLPLGEERMLMAFHAPKAGSSEVAAMTVLNKILFQGENSRLHRILVDEKGIAGDVSGFLSDDEEAGLLIVQCAMRGGHSYKEALEIIKTELTKIQAGKISPDEIERAKTSIEFDFWSSLKSNSNVAENLGQYETVTGSWKKLFDVPSDISRVSKDYVIDCAKRYAGPSSYAAVAGIPSAGGADS